MVRPNRYEVHRMVLENADGQMIGGSLNEYDIAWLSQQGRKVVESLGVPSGRYDAVRRRW